MIAPEIKSNRPESAAVVIQWRGVAFLRSSLMPGFYPRGGRRRKVGWKTASGDDSRDTEQSLFRIAAEELVDGGRLRPDSVGAREESDAVG